MRKYLIIYEKGKDGYSAYLPDLPRCTTAGATKKEVEENIREKEWNGAEHDRGREGGRGIEVIASKAK